MKIKTLLSIGSLSILPLVFMSCSQQVGSKQELKREIQPFFKLKATDSLSWDNFLKQKPIVYLLDSLFDNQEARNDYIQQQMELDEQNSLKELKQALVFANGITTSYGHSGGLFSPQPTAAKESKKILQDQYLKQNWLWVLFHVDKLKYFYYPTLDLFSSSSSNYDLENKEQSLLSGSFVQSPSNKIQNFGSQVYNSEEDEYEENIFLELANGTILNAQIKQDFYDEKKVIQLSSYIFQFTNPEKNPFSIDQWINQTKSFLDKSANNVKTIAFNDAYGGAPKRFTLIDVKAK
ncbi:aromatic motif membrane protein [Mycoplasma sp. Ms02]|uniref:aromatic motif membrane protein n=1 Tax=Mycoplasma sp. Ms02 TaxID=353851 RepID=UPI001C89ADE6|nr:aromatic motif membrane protein [Mycoplasma sp. Ms02]QZE12547.1 hypothetical protein K4L35_00965 [Mycoplasma sp. Ms02]